MSIIFLEPFSVWVRPLKHLAFEILSDHKNFSEKHIHFTFVGGVGGRGWNFIWSLRDIGHLKLQIFSKNFILAWQGWKALGKTFKVSLKVSWFIDALLNHLAQWVWRYYVLRSMCCPLLFRYRKQCIHSTFSNLTATEMLFPPVEVLVITNLFYSRCTSLYAKRCSSHSEEEWLKNLVMRTCVVEYSACAGCFCSRDNLLTHPGYHIRCKIQWTCCHNSCVFSFSLEFWTFLGLVLKSIYYYLKLFTSSEQKPGHSYSALPYATFLLRASLFVSFGSLHITI